MEILSNWILWASVTGAVVAWKLLELAKGTIDKARQNDRAVIDGLWDRVRKLEVGSDKARQFTGIPKDFIWTDPSLQTQINVLSDKFEKAVENGSKNWGSCELKIARLHDTYERIVIDHAKALDALEAKVKELREAKGSQCMAEKPACPPKTAAPPPAKPTSSRRTR